MHFLLKAFILDYARHFIKFHTNKLYITLLEKLYIIKKSITVCKMLLKLIILLDADAKETIFYSWFYLFIYISKEIRI